MRALAALRPAKADDREFLAKVYAATRHDELAMTDWTEEQKGAFCQMQFEAQDAHYRLHYQNAEYCVIESGGEPAGRLYVDRWAREIRIMDIALLPGFRGRGIGKYLLENLQDEATSEGKTLSVHVERFNPALRLYERLGFQLAEDKGIYWLMKWSPQSVVT